jgi:hypothetical protein
MFIIKARERYRITGEPNVKNEVYIKNRRIDEVAIPNLSPSAVHTPKACFSK